MFDDEDELVNNIIYKPCKNCKATNYDNADVVEPNFTNDGKVEFEPTKCDKCDFSLLLSDSDLVH